MRLAIRSVITAFSAVALASCMDVFQSTAPAGKSRASLAIVPRFTQSATRASAVLAQVGLEFNRVRIVIVRPASDTLKDTTITFTPESQELTLELSIAATPAEALLAGVQFKQDNTVIFSGSANVKALSPTQASTSRPIEVDVDFVGPGATATKVAITPGSGAYSSTAATQFSAKAFDANNAEVPNTPLAWSVSDTTLATVSSAGLLTPKGQRGTLRLRSLATSGVADSVTVNLAPAAVALRVVQGASQTGPPGSTLALPVIVEAIAADGLPATGAGQSVTFSAAGGAQITPASVVLDANGRAQASMKLGTTPGTTYIYRASMTGAVPLEWGGIAAVGPPTHFVPSGSTTLTFVAGVAPNPLPTLRVADALENSVPGLFLKVTITGGDPIAPFQVPSDTIGILDVYKAAPTKAGSYTVLVEADPALSVPSITYNVTITPGPAAKLGFLVQPSNVGVGQAMTPVVKVAIQDQFGNTVTSAPTTNIAISVDAATGSGVGQTGTGSESTTGGIATFSNLRFNAQKTGIKIQAIGASLPAVFSAAFNITP